MSARRIAKRRDNGPGEGSALGGVLNGASPGERESDRSCRSRTPARWLSTLSASVALLCTSIPGIARAQDAGASTFASARRLYAPASFRPEQIPVPVVVTAAERLANAPTEEPDRDEGPTFSIARYEVLGDSLLGIGELDRTLEPFLAERASFALVERARRALEERYAEEGFLAVGVSIPPQNVEAGVVQLQVLEARLGSVEIENEGRRWVSDDRIASLTPHLRPGAVLREEDLQSDMVQANSQPDLTVRPRLRAGARPGTVDLQLRVDDRVPLHGRLDLYNQHTPGSPRLRALADLSYDDLWERGHSLGFSYGFTPTSQISDLQVLVGRYSLPSPLRADDRMSFGYVHSASENGIPGLPELTTIGRGTSITLGYEVGLPGLADSERGTLLAHGLRLRLDLKNIESTLLFVGKGAERPPPDPDDPAQDDAVLEEGGGLIRQSNGNPIRYRPLSLGYWLYYASPDAISSASVTARLNRVGFLGGDERSDFQRVTGQTGAESYVTGDYEALEWDFTQRLRLRSVLGVLMSGGAFRPGVPAVGEKPMADDWEVSLRSFGQLASEPLAPTEQMPGSGLRTVRGYLESEAFGDVAWGWQFEVISPPYTMGWGGRSFGRSRFVLFYDDMSFRTLPPDPEGEWGRERLYSVGLGIRSSWGRRLSSELMLGFPLVTTDNTERNRVRLDFRLGYGF